MLVLSRRIGEQIVIDGDICLTVVSVQGDKVRLGIVAPQSVRVDRQEVHQRRKEFPERPPCRQVAPVPADRTGARVPVATLRGVSSRN
jgi:carbon storage regulator